MEKNQMKRIAEDVFERYGVDKVYVTSDGQAFVDEHYARTHARNNRTGKELSLEVFNRQETAKAEGNKPEADDAAKAEGNKPETEVANSDDGIKTTEEQKSDVSVPNLKEGNKSSSKK